ncbi:MAG: hypothetical protein ACERKO_00270 [Acetanaerobacterium sp.]
MERVVRAENIPYLYTVFGKGAGLWAHFSNFNVYTSLIRGILSIGINERCPIYWVGKDNLEPAEKN